MGRHVLLFIYTISHHGFMFIECNIITPSILMFLGLGLICFEWLFVIVTRSEHFKQIFFTLSIHKQDAIEDDQES